MSHSGDKHKVPVSRSTVGGGSINIQGGYVSGGRIVSASSIAGDNVAGDKIIGNRIGNSSELARVAKDINSELNSLCQGMTSFEFSDKVRISTGLVNKLDSSPGLKARVINVFRNQNRSLLEKEINHPVAKLFLAMLESLLEE